MGHEPQALNVGGPANTTIKASPFFLVGTWDTDTRETVQKCADSVKISHRGN
jgi:hypothetical protein